MKYLLVLLSIILALIPVVKAEDKSWYEIDGIKFRGGVVNHNLLVNWESEDIMEADHDFTQFKLPPSSPITIVLPERLLNSWSFSAGVLEWDNKDELKDLVPIPAKVDDNSEVNYLRQNSKIRTSLYNNFFNTSDKAFADENSNWALSADVTRSSIILGQTLGVFLPAFEYHRFLKVSFGLGIYYADISYKLNLCSQYEVTGNIGRYKGECVGKKEIDSSSWNGFGIANVYNVCVWERFTKDSIWRLFSDTGGNSLTKPKPKLKNHTKNLEFSIESKYIEFISYTYRF